MARRLDKRLDLSVDNIQQLFDVMFECGVKFASVTVSRGNISTGGVKSGTVEATEKWYLYGDQWKAPIDSYPGSLNRDFLKSTRGNQLRTALSLAKSSKKSARANTMPKPSKKVADNSNKFNPIPPLSDLVNFHRLLFSRFYNNKRWLIGGRPPRIPALSYESLDHCDVDSSYSSYNSAINLCGLDTLESWSSVSLDKPFDITSAKLSVSISTTPLNPPDSELQIQEVQEGTQTTTNLLDSVPNIEESSYEDWESCYLYDSEDKIVEANGVANKIVYKVPQHNETIVEDIKPPAKQIPLAREDSFPEAPTSAKYISTIIELTGATVNFLLADITMQLRRIGSFSRLLCCDIVWSVPVGQSAQVFEAAIQQTVDQATERWQFAQSYQLYVSSVIEHYSMNLSTNQFSQVPVTVEVGIYRKRADQQYFDDYPQINSTEQLHKPYWDFSEKGVVASVQQLLLSKKPDANKSTSFLMINLITTAQI